MDADCFSKIIEDITIYQAGPLSPELTLKYASANHQVYLMVVSRSGHTRLRFDGEVVNLHQDQIIIYPAEDGHRFEVFRGSGLYVYFGGSLASRYLENDIVGIALEFGPNDSINKSVGELEAVLDKNLAGLASSKLAFSILFDICMLQRQGSHVPKLVVDAVRTIENEYGFLYGVEDLADRMGVSKSYLIRLFKMHLNVTPGQYLEKHRIFESKLLLSSGELSVDTIAKICGFSCSNYFSKVFKKYTGINPTQFAKSSSLGCTTIPPEFYI